MEIKFKSRGKCGRFSEEYIKYGRFFKKIEMPQYIINAGDSRPILKKRNVWPESYCEKVFTLTIDFYIFIL